MHTDLATRNDFIKLCRLIDLETRNQQLAILTSHPPPLEAADGSTDATIAEVFLFR